MRQVSEEALQNIREAIDGYILALQVDPPFSPQYSA
jgi:predicted RNase H-like HicB family nuclease